MVNSNCVPAHPVNIIHAINAANTQKDKEALIVDYCTDNTLLKRAVRMALDNSLSFHTKSLDFLPPKTTLFGGSCAASVEEVLDALLELDKKGSCSGIDKARISEQYSTLSDLDRQLVDMVLNRKVQCGAGVAKFRKAWGEDFLPDFPCYLSHAFDEEKIMKYIFGDAPYAFSECKTDGQRCMAKVMTDGIRLHSRNGKQYFGLHKLETHIGMLEWDKEVFGEEVVIDGELVLLDEDGNIMPRALGNGKISPALKGKVKPEVAENVLFVVWDIIPMKEFTGEIPMGDDRKIMMCDRNHELSCSVDYYVNELFDLGFTLERDERIRMQKGREVRNIGEAMEHYAEMVAQGEEGTILKYAYGDWDPCPNKKRPLTQFKFKEVFEGDFVITGWYPGDPKGKYADAIGGFYMESADGKVQFNCGGGLSDDIRFDKDPDRFTGKIGNVEYNARSQAAGRDTFSLTHPRMVEICEGKTGADTLERIIEQEEATREMKRCMGQ